MLHHRQGILIGPEWGFPGDRQTLHRPPGSYSQNLARRDFRFPPPPPCWPSARRNPGHRWAGGTTLSGPFLRGTWNQRCGIETLLEQMIPIDGV